MNFFFEGNIGAGKSTFVKILSEHIDDSIAKLEPVNQWKQIKDDDDNTILDLFYGDIKRYSYFFQSVAFRTRIKLIEDTRKNDNHKFRFFERSVYADRFCFALNCYENGLMNKAEWTDYINWFEWLTNEFKLSDKMDGIIYVRTDPEVAFDRIQKRGRESEKGITLEYLICLNKKHDELIEVLSKLGLKILTIDGNLDFKNDPNIQSKLVKKVKDFIN